MGLFGSLIGGAVSSAIKRAKNKSSSSNYSSGSSSSSSSGGGVSSSTTNSLRDYLGQYGENPTVDNAARTVSFGGKTYNFGDIPGTTFDATTGQHYVSDPGALNKATGIGSPTAIMQQPIMQAPQQYQFAPQQNQSEYINQLKEAQRQARIAALDKAKSNALSSLESHKTNTLASLDTQKNQGLTQLQHEQSSIAPVYYDKRNQAAAASDVGAMNFAQYMAARGIKGAAGAMPEIYRQAGLQGQIGALDRAEAGTIADIERRRTQLGTDYDTYVNALNQDYNQKVLDVEGNYSNDYNKAVADIESQALQNYINQMNLNRQYELQVGQATGNIGGIPTLESQKFDWSKSSSNPENRSIILANKAQEMENAAQEIRNSYLPETLKLQAEKLAQQVKAGSLDYDTALAQLNQIKAQTKATNAPKEKEPSQTEVGNYYISSALNAMNNLNPLEKAQWLRDNQVEIIQNAGTSAYDYLAKQINSNETDANLVGLFNEMNSLPTQEAKNAWLWENRESVLDNYGQEVYDRFMKEIYG